MITSGRPTNSTILLFSRFQHLISRFHHLISWFRALFSRFRTLISRFQHLFYRLQHLFSRFQHLFYRFIILIFIFISVFDFVINPLISFYEIQLHDVKPFSRRQSYSCMVTISNNYFAA